MSDSEKFDSDVVIGLEIHVSLNTNSKLFCSCKNSHSSEPNENVCPVCLGHPGSRPTLNGKAVEYAVMLAKALNFKIADNLVFSRKTYFYPDLAKNFQITQYEEPLGKDGFVEISVEDGKGIVEKNGSDVDIKNGKKIIDKKIGLERIHIEEDPGSLIHKGNNVLIDYNRSGCPLCEIVTKPEISSPGEARAVIKKMLTIVNYLSIFDYENGTIKADLNVSIKKTGYKRVEIKGVSGFKDIQDALEYEISRHKESPEEVLGETRGYDVENKITFSQRLKESEDDYGYIYESDIVPRKLDGVFLENIFSKIPTLPDERVKKYVAGGVNRIDAESIASLKELSDFFDWLLDKKIDKKITLRFLTRELLSTINEGMLLPRVLDDERFRNNVMEIIRLFSERKINNHTARETLFKVTKDLEFNALDFIKKNNLIIDSSMNLESVCEEAINESEQAVSDYHSGKTWAVNYIVGQVMKKTKGQAMPDDVKEILIRKLDAMKR